MSLAEAPERPLTAQKVETPIVTKNSSPELSQELINGITDDILSVWPDERAVLIAKCESRLNRNVFNPETEAKAKGITKYSSWGLFQINGPEFDGWNDPKINTVRAKKLYDQYGFSPWLSCAKKLGLPLNRPPMPT